MFTSHGHFQVTVEGDTIQVSAFGPFNAQAVNTYKTDLDLAIKNIHGNWGQLNLMHNNCLYTPDAQLDMRHLTLHRKEQGMVAVAFIFNECFGELILKQQLSEIYASCDVPCDFFENREQASQWLNQHIASS